MTTLGQNVQSPEAKVGNSYREYKDKNRLNWLGSAPRPLRVTIWYPSIQGGSEKEINNPTQFAEPVTILNQGILSKSQKYPLVILSHGSIANADQMQWLAFYLASRGYIVSAINHNGTPEEERQSGPMPLTEICMWERPKDISAVIDQLLVDSIFGAQINPTQIGVGGFSLGGATAIWLAGPKFNSERLQKNSPKPPEFLIPHIEKHLSLLKSDTSVQRSFSHSQDSFLDKRIKSVFALGPAIGQAFYPEELSKIKIPVSIVAGEKDLIAPVSMNAEYYAGHIPSSKLTIIPGEGGHYTSGPKGNNQALELKKVSEIAFAFFEKTLK